MIWRLRDETGLGLPLAMGVLLIVMGLAAWSVSVADQLHRSSERDRGAKRALGPADAGLQRAAWRLAQTAPTTVSATQCVVSRATGDEGVTCGAAPATVSLGNGATYSYTATAAFTAPTTCAGQTGAVGDRCVTATGTANGVARRVQALLHRPLVDFVYKHSGLIGKSSVTSGNNVKGYVCSGEPPSEIGSNGPVSLDNSTQLNASGCGGSGSFTVYGQSFTGVQGTGQKPGGYTLPQISIPGTTAEWNTAAANLISSGTGATWVGGIGQRNLKITGNVELRGGTYVLCQVVQEDGIITVKAGETAKIYIDSPDRNPASGCAAGTGGFWIQNNEAMNWGTDPSITSTQPATRAPQLQVFVYGSSAWETSNRPCNGSKAGSVLICNGSKFAGTIYAPTSKVVLSNQTQIVGAIVADKLVLENGVQFRVPDGLGTQVITQTVDDAQVARWTECPGTGTGTSC